MYDVPRQPYVSQSRKGIGSTDVRAVSAILMIVIWNNEGENNSTFDRRNVLPYLVTLSLSSKME